LWLGVVLFVAHKHLQISNIFKYHISVAKILFIEIIFIPLLCPWFIHSLCKGLFCCPQAKGRCGHPPIVECIGCGER
jgi:hypothetical protein